MTARRTTEAIQQVFNRFSDRGLRGQPRQHVVYFPPGRYRITRTLSITKSTGGWLVGHGRTTVIFWDGEEGGRMLLERPTSSFPEGLVRGMDKGKPRS